MSFWKIAWRNIQQRALASSLTALSMALGVAVMIAVIVIHSVAVRQFSQNAQGYHLIVGGKGGSLQLVLSTVYHLGQPLYPIPYTYYQKFVDGEFSSVTEVAVPMCLGDSYEAPDGSLYRVIGTTPDLFDKIQYGVDENDEPASYEFAEGGRNLRDASQLTGEEFAKAAFEAVVGSVVASQAGIQVGDHISPTHGISGEGEKHQEFTVVGILKPTGTRNDRAVFVNIEGFYLLEGHSLGPPEIETFQAVVGSAVAEKAHVKVGDRITPNHGERAVEASRRYEVVGILSPTDAVNDRAVFVSSDAFDLVDDGAEATAGAPDADAAAASGPASSEADSTVVQPAPPSSSSGEHSESGWPQPLPVAQREVTSILVKCNSPLGPMVLDTGINKGEDRIAQSVAPAREVALLLDGIVGPIRIVLLVLTVLIVIVAGISILVSIYNSMSERSHDIAVMRALGASRGAVMLIILVESILLSLGGGLIGIALAHGLIGLASPYLVAKTGVALRMFQFEWQELVLIPALVVLASLVGFLPAIAAYRTDVAKSLGGSR